MKKIFILLVMLIFSLSIVACNTKTSLKDGKYFAFSTSQVNNWQSFISYEVKDNKMFNVVYDAINLMDGVTNTRLVEAKNGNYKLASDNAGEWDVQAQRIAKYIEENNGDVSKIKFNDAGYSDTIAGATIKYSDITVLIEKSIKNGVVSQGKYQDGIYFASADKLDENGYRNTLGLYVYNGNIVAAHADGFILEKDSEGKQIKLFKTVLASMNPSKYDLSRSTKNTAGDYTLQAQKIDDYIIKNGNLDIKLDNDGKDIDAKTGATINISSWLELFNKLKFK